MSLETWKAEFYPIEACDVPKEAAIAHSLQKWIGLRKENVERHGGMHTRHRLDFYSGRFYADSGACALCLLYMEDPQSQCRNCPLVAVLGEPCDERLGSPYQVWYDTSNPELMIAALQKALAAQEGNE